LRQIRSLLATLFILPMQQAPFSVFPLASALVTAVKESEQVQTLSLVRTIILASKPLLDLSNEDLGTDLLCLVNYKINRFVSDKELAFYSEKVRRDLVELAASEHI